MGRNDNNNLYIIIWLVEDVEAEGELVLINLSAFNAVKNSP